LYKAAIKSLLQHVEHLTKLFSMKFSFRVSQTQCDYCLVYRFCCSAIFIPERLSCLCIVEFCSKRNKTTFTRLCNAVGCTLFTSMLFFLWMKCCVDR
jgi:hypothetical protein